MPCCPLILQFELGVHHFVVERVLQGESQLLANPHYAAVVRQDVRDQAIEFFVGAHNQQPRQQLLAESPALPVVAISTATSASRVPWTFIMRPTPRISLSPVLG